MEEVLKRLINKLMLFFTTLDMAVKKRHVLVVRFFKNLCGGRKPIG